MKQTLKEAKYKYIKYLGNGEHLLKYLSQNQNDIDYNASGLEIWFANKNHASYGLIYKNTHLEFARSYIEQV